MKNDLKTTILGSGAGALIFSTVDVAKLGALDHTEIAKVGLGVLLVLLGYFTNKVHGA